MQNAINEISCWIAKRERHYVCVTPAHGIMETWQDPELLPLFNRSGMITPDGMSIVWILKLRGYSNVGQVSGTDLLQELASYSLKNGWRHFFYGGRSGVPELLARRLEERYPELRIAGYYSPPFRPLTHEEDDKIIKMINEAQPDIVWVGLSTPIQERWMDAHLDKLTASVLIGVGAAFDFLAGTKKRAPRWVQHIGMEWLYRFASEPKRLFPRYSHYPLFIWLVILESIGFRVVRKTA